MTDKAKELLVKMANEQDASGQTSFDFDFYITFPQEDVIALENEGYILAQNDVAGTIHLTDIGYREAKK